MRINILDLRGGKIVAVIYSSLTLLILWQMLLPGYILTLDMVWGPTGNFFAQSDGFLNFMPISLLLQGLPYLLPADIVQKIVLFVLFFLLQYIPYRYLPNLTSKTTRILAGILYALTPFVYGRFLAGHWQHLYAYAFLPFWFHTLLIYRKSPSLKSSCQLFGSLFLLSLFSLHLFAMASIISGGTILISLCQKNKKQVLITSMAGGGLFLIASSYWIIPAILRSHPLEQRITLAHWQAFQSAGHGNIPAWFNLLTLNGFWGEQSPWNTVFLWPQSLWYFWVSLFAFTGVFSYGTYHLWKKERSSALLILGIGVISYIFATGIAPTIFAPLNQWLLSYVPLWNSFRDSQKWIAFTSLAWILCISIGLDTILAWAKKKSETFFSSIIFLISICILLYGSLFMGGFRHQISPVQYPPSWEQVRNIIQQDKRTKNILILPWHGYLSFYFAHNRLMANPGQKFFGERVITSKSMEIKNVIDQEVDPSYTAINDAIVHHQDPKEIMTLFQKNNITHIIQWKELEQIDPLLYPFLSSPFCELIWSDENIALYALSAP